MHWALKKSSNIIWDWNGTLLNDVDICVNSVNTLLVERGITPLSTRRYLEIFTFPVKDYYIEAGFDFVDETFETVAINYMQLYGEALPNCSLHDSTVKILSRFQSEGYRQIILSAMEHVQLCNLVKQLGLNKYFEAVYGISNQLGAGKDDIALKALSISNFIPDSTCMIGDSLHDAEIARLLKINCILISHGHQSAERLKTSGFEVVSNLDELIR